LGYLDYWRWYFWLVDKSTEEKERRQMKTLITIFIMLIAVGCSKPAKIEDSVVGTYEAKIVMKQSGVPTLFTLKYVLLENRNIEVYEDGERKEDAKWEMVGKEIHAERGGGQCWDFKNRSQR
jgi:hypothetical protein